MPELAGEDKGKKKLTGHQLAHQLARDCEHVSALVTEHYAMTDMDYRAKMRMWVWDTKEAHTEAQEKFQGTISGGDFKLLGRDPVFSVWDEPGNFDTVTKVRSVFVHNAAHMLLSNAFQPNWVGDIGGGWLDVGVGAWYEYELFGRVRNYCLEESTSTRATRTASGAPRAPVLEKKRPPPAGAHAEAHGRADGRGESRPAGRSTTSCSTRTRASCASS